MKPGHLYKLEVESHGSQVRVTLNGVPVLEARLNYNLVKGQSGLWACSETDVRISDFEVTPESPKLFVIMQFSPRYDELYEEVIETVGEELGFNVIRGDEAIGPGHHPS